MKNRKKEMTIAEKVVLTAMAIAAITYLLRMWDPAFFRWFHMVPMQEVSFLRNIWQATWLTFQVIVYLVWIISALWILIFMVVSFIAIIILIITFIFDLIIAIYNLTTRIIPLPRLEISICGIYSEFIEDISYKVLEYEVFGNAIEEITPIMIAICFAVSIFFIIPLTVTQF